MYDVIVVGARCAGSPTAMLLARQGYRVLLVDRATFPSELPMSTHLLWPPAVLRLQRWGVLEAVRACCPAISIYDLDLGAFHLRGSPPPVGGVGDAYSPRRVLLDHLLVQEAVKAGVELREKFTMEALLFDDGRVSGIRGGHEGGATVAEEAKLVVGADGPSSLVARSVQAVEYNEREPIQGTCWSYWSGVRVSGFEAHLRDYQTVYGWQTADGLALIGANWVAEEFDRLGSDVERSFFERLDTVAPGLAGLAREGCREERWYRGSTRNFFRRPYGPGWALVGDAGYTKDPFTAQGITDAFRDAELLVAAIDDGLSGRCPLNDALADYERGRNEAAQPFFELTCQFAAQQPPPPEMIQLFGALQGNEADTSRFLGLLAMTVSPTEFFAPENVQRILG
jgi:flavin-dependent dehydrogenase